MSSSPGNPCSKVAWFFSLLIEASAYHSPAKRAAYCQKPWLASVALLGVEASVAASSGYSLAFLQAGQVAVDGRAIAFVDTVRPCVID